MKGILYVLHGRRKGRLSKEVLSLAERLPQLTALQSEVVFLEGEEDTLEIGVEKLAGMVAQLIVVPILLFPATHAQIDLPERLAKLAIPYQILPTLGTTEAVYQQVLQGVKSVSAEKTASVLLIAHGTTHFAEPQQQLEAIAERLSLELGITVLTGNHLGEPNFKNVLATQEKSLIVVPLFLSPSFLYRNIKASVRELRGEQDQILPALTVATNLEAVKERLGDAGCIQ